MANCSGQQHLRDPNNSTGTEAGDERTNVSVIILQQCPYLHIGGPWRKIAAAVRWQVGAFFPLLRLGSQRRPSLPALALVLGPVLRKLAQLCTASA